MNLKKTLIPIMVVLLGQAHVWSQVQWAAPGPGMGDVNPGFAQVDGSFPAGPVMHATCDDCGVAGGCDCDGGYYSGLVEKALGLNACGGYCGGGCADCLAVGRVWGDVEYLLWWSKERFVPVLATSSPAGTPANVSGRLGQPTTAILFGNDLVGGDPQSGVRLSFGGWLDQRQTYGVGLRYFFVGDEDDGFSTSSNGAPNLARPFFNVDPTVNAQDALLLAFPGQNTGGIDISTTNQAQGFDIYLRTLLLSGGCNRLDFIGGYQHTEVDDEVSINDSFTVIVDPDLILPQGSVVSTHDLFKVENQFDGGFVGLMGVAEDGRLTWRMLTKVAFGNMNQQTSISGSTTTSVPGAGSASRNLGLLALPTNIGTYEQDVFAVVPELSLSVGYKLTRNIQLTAGYSYIYWSKIALAGDVIDTTINPTQINGPLVGPAQPSVTLTEGDGFWYQGLTLGGNVRF